MKKEDRIAIKFRHNSFRTMVANYIEENNTIYRNDLGFLEAMRLFEKEDEVEILLPMLPLENQLRFISKNNRTLISSDNSPFIKSLIRVLENIEL